MGIETYRSLEVVSEMRNRTPGTLLSQDRQSRALSGRRPNLVAGIVLAAGIPESSDAKTYSKIRPGHHPCSHRLPPTSKAGCTSTASCRRPKRRQPEWARPPLVYRQNVLPSCDFAEWQTGGLGRGSAFGRQFDLCFGGEWFAAACNYRRKRTRPLRRRLCCVVSRQQVSGISIGCGQERSAAALCS